jgi:hypothetical protein
MHGGEPSPPSMSPRKAVVVAVAAIPTLVAVAALAAATKAVAVVEVATATSSKVCSVSCAERKGTWRHAASRGLTPPTAALHRSQHHLQPRLPMAWIQTGIWILVLQII